MSLTLQTDAGGVAGANAYIDHDYFETYHGDRQNDVKGWTKREIEAAIVRATDYLDQRFSFVGQRLTVSQTTDWPRINAEDRDQHLLTGIPERIKEATAEYAKIALSSSLNPTPTRDDTGQVVSEKFQKVDVIETKTVFSGGSGAFEMPKYPAADAILFSAGLVQGGTRHLGRA